MALGTGCGTCNVCAFKFGQKKAECELERSACLARKRDCQTKTLAERTANRVSLGTDFGSIVSRSLAGLGLGQGSQPAVQEQGAAKYLPIIILAVVAVSAAAYFLIKK